MMKKNKLLAAALSSIFILSLLGCGANAADTDTDSQALQIEESNQAPETKEPAPDAAEPEEKTPAPEPVPAKAEEVGTGEIISVPDVSDVELGKTGIKFLSVEVGKDETKLNFTWFSKSKEEGIIYFQEASDMAKNQFYNSNGTKARTKKSKTVKKHYVNKGTVSGLKPNTIYYYSVGNQDGWSPVYTYRTPDTANGFSFAAISDPEMGIGTDDESLDQVGMFENTINKIREKIPEAAFLLSAGDQVALPDNQDNYKDLLNHVGLYSLPFAPIIGNHDVGGNYFKEHFNVPNLNKIKPAADVVNDNYYFSYNNVLFLMINSNNGSDFDDFHRKFIEEASAQYPDARWKVAVFHHSPYSSVEKYQQDAQAVREIVPFLEDAGVDLVLNGHDHVYTRTHVMKGNSISQKVTGNSVANPDGIVYITLSSSSGNLFHPEAGNANAVVTGNSGIPQASRVDVTDTSLKISTYNTDTWELYDEFEIVKQ